MSVREAKAELAATGRWMAENGFLPATSGNLSCRVSADEIAITPSGSDKGNLNPDDLIVMTLAERPPRGTSAETPLHVQLYRDRPAVGAVLHGHSLVSTELSLKHQARGSLTLSGYELLKAFRGVQTHEARVEIPIFANDQDLDALAVAVSTGLAARPEAVGYLLAGHGSYSWGETIREARRHFEALEFLMTLQTRLS
jgi:methylthioribulose-1-phosphate dehydratase